MCIAAEFTKLVGTASASNCQPLLIHYCQKIFKNTKAMLAQKKTDEVFKQYFQNNECYSKIITFKGTAEYAPAIPVLLCGGGMARPPPSNLNFLYKKSDWRKGHEREPSQKKKRQV